MAGGMSRQVARLKRRLAFVQVADGADLRQQDSPAAGRADEGLGQGAGAAPGGGEDHGPGQGFRLRQGRQKPGCQVIEEGPVSLDREPARRRVLEQVLHPASRACA